MARGGVCDALCQAFRKETINNEDKLRMKWFIKNRSRLLEDLQREDENIKEKLKKLKIESQLCLATPEQGEVAEVPETESSTSVKSHKDTVLRFMRPIDPGALDILYDKKEMSHEARKKYLKERCKLAPEDRFFVMDCTNWSYGWKVKKFQTLPPKEFNRKPLIRSSFFRNNLSSIKNDDRPCCKKGLVKFAKNFKEIQES